MPQSLLDLPNMLKDAEGKRKKPKPKPPTAYGPAFQRAKEAEQDRRYREEAKGRKKKGTHKKFGPEKY